MFLVKWVNLADVYCVITHRQSVLGAGSFAAATAWNLTCYVCGVFSPTLDPCGIIKKVSCNLVWLPVFVWHKAPGGERGLQLPRLDQVRTSTVLIVCVFLMHRSPGMCGARGGEDRANQLSLSPPSTGPADKSQERGSGSLHYHNNQIAGIKISFE